METTWGLMGPEFLPNARRTRTLGLDASVRLFNDLAVPSLGRVWYSKQLLLATLGVAVAEKARSQGAKVQNIEVTNAIEALACWLAFNSNGWKSDGRLRGKIKLQGKADFSFRHVRQRNFYVTQPMRTATIQALPALGFVESHSTRFNAFRCSDEGMGFIEKATERYCPYNRTVIDHLTYWVQGGDRLNSPPLREVLSPLEPFPTEAIPLLRERLIQGGLNESPEDQKRRGDALKWVDALRVSRKKKVANPIWEQQPQEVSEKHWHDLRTGALFFEMRKAAIAVLDATEAYIGNQAAGQSYSLNMKVPKALNPTLEDLKSAATQYSNIEHADEEANHFCRECLNNDPSSVLRSLVKRDDRVLRLVGDEVKPGPAFRSSGNDSEDQQEDDSENQDTPQQDKTEKIPLPEGISYRVRNLYLLNLDMHGELNGWLNPSASGGEA